MSRCEVCTSFRPHDPTERPLVEVSFDVRSVLLCRGHARIAEKNGIRTFEDLRSYYGSGRRSHVPRRDPRAAVRDSENRRSPGRRRSDRETSA